MTNKERYQQAFSALPLPRDFHLEETSMKQTRTHFALRTAAAAVLACAVLFGTAVTAYAADLGGIQRKLQVWIHGDQTSATITFDGSGGYTMDYTDSQGKQSQISGGGNTFAPDGTPIPLSEEELMERYLHPHPEVEYLEDGTVWVYWYDQKTEITDRFQDGVCYLKLEHGEETMYLTVKYQGGSASSPHKFIPPEEFNITRGEEEDIP